MADSHRELKGLVLSGGKGSRILESMVAEKMG